MDSAADRTKDEEIGTARRNVSLRLHIVARFIRKRFDRNLNNLGVTRSRWAMIVAAAHRPGSTQRTLAEALEMSEASAGRLVDRLCGDGLLRREERDDDRRARAVYVTDQARPMLDELAIMARVNEAAVFRGFSHEELQQFENFLDRLYANATRQAD
jgi:MarR family transcriptional regulator, transcriptional regulator for hemolysin